MESETKMAVLNFQWDGMVGLNPRIVPKRMRSIERDPMFIINGIIIHQTGTATATQVFNSYSNPGTLVPDTRPNGAHFLIDLGGTIYQTASILRTTNHVGPIKPRCLEKHWVTKACSAEDLARFNAIGKMGQKELDKYRINPGDGHPTQAGLKSLYEKFHKRPPERFPSNDDSIGIECVSQPIIGPDKKPMYGDITFYQKDSLKWLVTQLKDTLKAMGNNTIELFAHIEVSAKTPGEGMAGVNLFRNE
jgi:hypothetical protein